MEKLSLDVDPLKLNWIAFQVAGCPHGSEIFGKVVSVK
jgi:hypothetical protein